MVEAQTWVIVVKFKRPVPVKKNTSMSPLFRPRSSRGLEITGIRSISLDKPMIIIPDGTTDTIEIFPITDPATLHGRNFRRKLK
jgi:hypothetical protein